MVQAARTVHIQPSELLHVQFVSHRPQDFIQGDLQCLLLQKSSEFKPSPYLRIVLLEIELHIPNEEQTTPCRRFARWIPYSINRRSVFRILNLETLCQNHAESCHLWHNNALVDRSPTALLHIDDGDFIKIFVGETPVDEDCSLTDNDTIAINRSAEESDALELFQHSTTFAAIECKTDPSHIVSQSVPISFVPQQGQPADRLPMPNFCQDDERRFHNLFAEQAFIRCEEEGPVANVETWYIHHLTHRICRAPRAVRLHGDSATWKQDLLEPWQAQLEPTLPTSLSVVVPKPPGTIFECIMAHVIIEQGTRRDFTIGMISLYSVHRPSAQDERAAYSLPTIMNGGLAMRIAEVQTVCQRWRCSLRVGALPFGTPFGLTDWEPVERATGFVIHMHPPEIAETQTLTSTC